MKQNIILVIIAALLVALFVTILQGCKTLPPAVLDAIHTSDKKDIEQAKIVAEALFRLMDDVERMSSSLGYWW